MKSLKKLFEANAAWAKQQVEKDPEFFHRLAAQQSPEYLWIGCSDSRVPANQITGLDPGEVFVARNVANVFVHTNVGILSVLQYAVEVLKVKHVIVCGHYGCGGVKAAMENKSMGIIDNWLRHVKDVYALHQSELDAIGDNGARFNRLCELNVQEQVANVARTSVVQDAWKRGQALHVHGWVYSLKDGLLKDLDFTIDGPNQLPKVYRYE